MIKKIFPKCPLCDGSGFHTFLDNTKNDHGHRAIYQTSIPCICRRNYELSRKYPQLSTLPDATDEDRKRLEFITNQKSLLFTGDYYTFLMMVKTYLIGVKDGYLERNLITTSSEFVDKFFMPKDFGAGDNHTITDNEYYDRMFLSLSSSVVRPSTKSVISDLVQGRASRGMLLWIHSPKALLTDCKEYSDELLNNTRDFKKVPLYKLSFTHYVGHSEDAGRGVNEKLGGI